MSLDGYYEGPNEQVDAIWKYQHANYKHDMSFHYFNMELIRSSFVLVLGRKTYLDKFNVNWTQMLHDPKSKFIEQEIASSIAPIEKIIVSDSLQIEDILPGNNAKIIKREALYKRVADLKQQSNKNIAIIGSRTLWQDLLAHDLVDELRLTIAPVFSGTGTLLFDHQPEIYLKRTDIRIAEGNMMIAYEVSRNRA